MSNESLLASVRAAAEHTTVSDNAAAPVAPAITQAQVDAALAEGETAGRAAGAADERARISAILGHDEAKNRPATARQLAFSTSMSVADAATFMAGLPEESAAAPKTNRLDAIVPNPHVDAAAPVADTSVEDGLAAAVDRQIGARKR